MSRFPLVSVLLVGMALLSRDGQAQDPGTDMGVAGDLMRSAEASPQEMLAYAASANLEMRESVKTVSRLLEAARREANVERLQCLTNRLTAIRALTGVSETAEADMKAQLEAGANEAAQHHFRKIAVALAKSRQLLAEAQLCSDQGAAANGQTTIDVVGGVTSEEDDTSDIPVDIWDLGVDPPSASPFR